MNGEQGNRDVAGFAGSLFFLCTGLFVFFESLTLSPLAAAFPRTIGATLAGLALLQAAASLTGRSGGTMETGAAAGRHADGLGRKLTMIATMVGWALLFPLVGMFVTSLAACLILMATGLFERVSRGRLAAYLAGVTAMVAAFYLLMSHVLNIPLPRGALF
ncbi:tripartite tricarboxylate transporter TctB family protein [Stappia sp. F7233]|uniref:Tripartite tricarboxylate transporter TctB family protein n=1 Tax=Stappia albiluteola TaxID=2758565 RepID=A0A839A9I4_9HYPH|nr:tripartite tricarboxylate transporter TctB family protein [Stappia albiluteola]MBA5776280.1 tripartite tricarboxylate transporter TctB family protein [Stappia albiluteola]